MLRKSHSRYEFVTHHLLTFGRGDLFAGGEACVEEGECLLKSLMRRTFQ